jgi:IS605 OrfB family transposase
MGKSKRFALSDSLAHAAQWQAACTSRTAPHGTVIQPSSRGIHRCTIHAMIIAIIAHKRALDPNEGQRSYFARASGTARFAYHGALAEWNQQYLAGEEPSTASVRRKLNSIKDEQFPWMREVTKNAPQQAITNLGGASCSDRHIRNDALHKLTTDPVKRFDTIGIEDLNVRGMVASRHLARAVADVGMSEFGRRLTDKAALHGTRIVMADRWFPSSKKCSHCGHLHADLRLSDREWRCEACGVIHHRDRNSAINLKNFAASLCGDTAEFRAVTACGEDGR